MDNSTALIPAPIKREVLPYEQCQHFAGVAAASKLFLSKEITNPEKALAIIMIGREMGLGPAASIRGIYMINGMPSLSARVMASLIKQSGEWDYETLKWDNKGSEIQFLKRVAGKWVPQTPTSSFTMEDAKLAGVLNRKDSPWLHYPKNMCWARALSNGFGIFCPHLANGLPVYGVSDEETRTPANAPGAAGFAQAGSDIPDAEFEPLKLFPVPEIKSEPGEKLTEEQVGKLLALAGQKGASVEAIRLHHKVADIKELSQVAYEKVMKVLEAS
jgi:hypothetical protein